MQQSVWQLQEAKNKFSHVVDLAVHSGVQTITKHGKPAVVILSASEYMKISKPGKSLFAALTNCPADLASVIPPRSKEKVRGVNF